MKAFFGVLAACGVLMAVSAAPAAANHSWGGYHWARTANPFTLQLDNNLTTTQWRQIGAEVAGLPTPFSGNDWSDSAVLDTPLSGFLSDNKRCKPTSGKVEVCNGKYGYNGWLGLAQVWISGGHIVQGTTKVNDTYLASSSYTATKRKHVLCQEVGHTFGLGHTSEDGSDQNTCMDYSRDLGNPTPSGHDYDQLASIYAHLDSSTTVGGSSGTSARFDRVKRLSHDHPIDVQGVRHDIYVEDFGHGNKRIVWVHWKDKAASESAPKDRIPE